LARDFHRTAFDEGTKVKLGLFRDYTSEWLPVWLSMVGPQTPITIGDFFAGPGTDSEGVPGSPLIVLAELRKFSGLIREKGARIKLLLNEADRSKARSLRETMEAQEVPMSLCTWEVHCRSFEDEFDAVFPTLGGGPNLLILDQQGMREVSDSVFTRILNLPRTDFLFFIASSSIRRFETHPYFQNHLRIPKGTISGTTFNDTHRAVTQYYRGLAATAGADCFLGRFSIKKGSNVYGLIFGSRHPLGLEKFLRICWKADPERGEANFDIDDDRLNPDAPRLFEEMNQPKKVTVFQRETKDRILSGELTSDRDVYVHTLQEGFLPSDGKDVVRDLVKSGQVRVIGGQARISGTGYADPRRLEISKSG